MCDDLRVLYYDRSLFSLRNACVSVIVTGTCLATFTISQLIKEVRKSETSGKLQSLEPVELVYDLYDEEPDEEEESVVLRTLSFVIVISIFQTILGLSSLYMLKKSWSIEAFYKQVTLWRSLWLAYAILQHVLRCMINTHKITQVQVTMLTITAHAVWIKFMWTSIDMRATIRNSCPMLPIIAPSSDPPQLLVRTNPALKKAE